MTVLGRDGDADHDLARYRGLAGRQPVLALAFAVLLLAQAGAPFTTGLWAKLQVVFAAVGAGEVPLGVIAMVTAVVAAYFYLRVAVLMYAGGGLGEPEGGRVARPHWGPRAACRRGHHRGGGRGQHSGSGAGAAGWPGPRRPRWPASVTTLNEQILLGGGPARWPGAVAGRRSRRARKPERSTTTTDCRRRCPVPALGGLAIALCTGVTVLFGVWPQPLIDFANHATLLFLPK